MSDIIASMKAIGGGMVALALLAVVLSQVAVVAVDINTADIDETALTVVDGTGEVGLPDTQSVATHNGTQSSLGTQVALTGASDSEVVVDADVGVATATDTWAVTTYATPASNSTATVLKYEDAAIIYNGSANEYRGYYYDRGERAAYSVRIAAGNTTSPTLVTLDRNASALRIHRNDTATASVSLASATGGAAPPPSTHFEGAIDETRIYNRTTDSTHRSELVAEPTLAVDGAAPAARITYDSRGGTEFPAFFAGGSATASNASLAESFDGVTLTRGTDYEWGGTELTVLSGSRLESTGEVLYHRFRVSTFGGLLTRLFGVGRVVIGLLAVGLLVIGARAVMNTFRGF